MVNAYYFHANWSPQCLYFAQNLARVTRLDSCNVELGVVLQDVDLGSVQDDFFLQSESISKQLSASAQVFADDEANRLMELYEVDSVPALVSVDDTGKLVNKITGWDVAVDRIGSTLGLLSDAATSSSSPHPVPRLPLSFLDLPCLSSASATSTSDEEEGESATAAALQLVPFEDALAKGVQLANRFEEGDVARALFTLSLALMAFEAQKQQHLQGEQQQLVGGDAGGGGENEDEGKGEAGASFNLGALLQMMELGRLAVPLMVRVVELRPDDATAHNVLSSVLHAQHPVLVLRLLRGLVRRQPTNVRAAHTVAKLGGGAEEGGGGGGGMSIVNPVYVAKVFDDMAPRFDELLVTHLRYRVPWLAQRALAHIAGLPLPPSAATDPGCASASASASSDTPPPPAPSPSSPGSSSSGSSSSGGGGDGGGPGWVCADLGCGTGLCGPLLRDWVRPGGLHGCDLAPNMVTRAAALGCYDRLAVGDLHQMLQEFLPEGRGGGENASGDTAAASSGDAAAAAAAAASGALTTVVAGPADEAWRGGGLDLVMAADVFIYIGDLGRALRLASEALLPRRGLLVFSVEALLASSSSSAPSASSGGLPDYTLQRSGRFAHSRGYIEKLCAEHGLRVVQADDITVRFESAEPIPGYLFICRSDGREAAVSTSTTMV